jgi:competence protein ComEA
MHNWLKSYFTISKREFNGMLVFLGIMGLIFMSPYIYDKLMFEPVSVKIETLQPDIYKIEEISDKPSYYDSSAETENKYKGILFKFDPNTLPLEGWIKLGLSAKQAASILKYVAKGGKFYKVEDVKKMYAISEANYQRLLPYIDIPSQNYSSTTKINTYTSKPILKSGERLIVDINEADSATLTNIRGIGPSFASRIIKYRNRLGGFVKADQLKEVYGLDSVKFDEIKDQIKINLSSITKINLNTAEFEEMKKIPYLTYKQINAILAYRKQHGNYSQLADLNKILILNSTLINKISNYVQF